MKIMKSMGVNAFRTSHNPPSPEMMAVCEELGIVTMVEAFDVWRQQKVQFDYARFFDANSEYDIKEMVDASRNNPSVIMWSIGNEIPGSTSAAGIPIAQTLINHIKARDMTRPIVIGSDQYRNPPEPHLAGGPDPRDARRARPQLQHRHVGRRAAPALPDEVPVRVGVLLGGVHARRLPGPGLAEHG